jgi:hypothetical protein
VKRRDFITLIGGAVAWPLAALAQQGERIRRIGVLHSLASDDPEGQARLTAFVQGLQELGWTDGRNVRARGLALRVLVIGRGPQGELSRTMDRNFYYIGIAFFGIVNGLFNQTWLLFALIHAQILSPALLFGSVGLTLMFASLMVSTATIILGGIPAAIYERWVGAKEDSTEASLWIWLAATGLLTLPAMGNFLEIGL